MIRATLDQRWRAVDPSDGIRSSSEVARVASWVCRETELQVGGLAEDTLGFSGVLHAWQLNHDAVGALALHERLGYTQLVDAVTDRGQVLLDRVFADFERSWPGSSLRRSTCLTIEVCTVRCRSH
jgi:hypothetical protein